jgi:cell division protein FtsB
MDIPTDKLPKFLAIGGLAIVFLFMYQARTDHKEFQTIRFQTQKELAREKAQYKTKSAELINLRNQIKNIKEKANATEEEKAQVAKLEALILNDIKPHIEMGEYFQEYESGVNEQAELLIKQYDPYRIPNVISILGALIISGWGFLWWWDVEKKETKKLSEEIRQIRAEIKELKK